MAMCGSLGFTLLPSETPSPISYNETLVQSSRQESKLLGLACCLLYNKPQSSAFNHVCLVTIIDYIHNAVYWNFLYSINVSFHNTSSASLANL